MLSTTLVSLFALVPAIMGPAALEQADHGGQPTAIVSLCNGGTIALRLADRNAPPKGTVPCCAKGCRRSTKRLARG